MGESNRVGRAQGSLVVGASRQGRSGRDPAVLQVLLLVVSLVLLVACSACVPFSIPFTRGPHPAADTHGIYRLPNLFGYDVVSYSELGSSRSPLPPEPGPGVVSLFSGGQEGFGWSVMVPVDDTGVPSVDPDVLRPLLEMARFEERLAGVHSAMRRLLGQRYRPLHVEVVLVDAGVPVRRQTRRFSPRAIPFRFYFQLPEVSAGEEEESRDKARRWMLTLSSTIAHEYMHALLSLEHKGDAWQGRREQEYLAYFFGWCSASVVALGDAGDRDPPRFEIRDGERRFGPEIDREEFHRVLGEESRYARWYWYFDSLLEAGRSIDEAIREAAQAPTPAERQRRLVEPCRVELRPPAPLETDYPWQ